MAVLTHIQRTIREVQHGLAYDVDVQIGAVLLLCKVRFTVSLTELAGKTASSAEEVQRICKIMVGKEEGVLSGAEYSFFYNLIAPLVSAFYQTRLLPVAVTEGFNAGVEVSAGGVFNLSDGTVALLRSPRFGFFASGEV